MDVLKIENLSYTYPDESKSTLANISFNAKENEILGIVGPSGCGKSTLLLAIAGLLQKNFGGNLSAKIELNRKELSKYSAGELAQHVQILFQNSESQLFSLNVEDEIAFGLENIGESVIEIRRRTDAILNKLAISNLRKQSIEELSAGQKQRVALAAVLAMKPKILLLDEPTTNLDQISVQRLATLLKDLKQELTIILIEHDIDFVNKLADTVILVNEGKIVKIADTGKMFSDKEYLKIMNPPSKTKAIKFSDVVNNTAKTVLKIEDFDYYYDNKVHALQKVNLEIKEGDFIGIVGINGSGKSTLALGLIGLLKCKGKLFFREKDISNQDTAERSKSIGYVFQNPDYQLFEESVSDEIAFGPKNLNFSEEKISRSVTSSLREVSLIEQKNKDPHALSVGQKRRVGIASILAMMSEIIILDEPDTGLDFKTAEKMMYHLKQLNKKGKTIIMISHDIQLVTKYCTKIIGMSSGRIISKEKLAKVYFRQ